MPFIGWFVAAITTLVGDLVTFFGKKWALRIAFFTAFSVLTVAFVTLLVSFVQGLTFVYPDSYVLAGFRLLPDNTALCLSAYISAAISKWIYELKYSFLARWLDSGGF